MEQPYGTLLLFNLSHVMIKMSFKLVGLKENQRENIIFFIGAMG